MADGTAGGASSAPAEPRALVARLYAALGASDRDELLRLLHPEFEGRMTAGMPADLGGTYRGPEAMCRIWGRIGRLFDVRAVPRTWTDLPDGRLLIEGDYTGSARTGGSLDAAFVHLFGFADGRISVLEQLTDSVKWNEALDAVATASLTVPAGQETRPVVTFTVDDGLAVLRLDRPDARNAINAALVTGLADTVHRCAADPAIRALLICANGPAFSVGGDIGMFAASNPDQLSGDLRLLTTIYHATLHILDQLPVPVIAAVRGAVAGGALGLLYVADIVLAAEATRFATGFARLGLSGDGGGTWFLPRLIGLRRAAEMYLGQRVLTADDALNWGLITRVVPEADLDTEARQLARELASGPTRALGELRGLLRRAPDAVLADQLRAETQAIARTAASADALEGIAAFAAGTRPQFRGR